LEKRSLEFIFCFGIFLGGIVAMQLLQNPEPVVVHPKLTSELASYGITDYSGLVPAQLFSWESVLTIKGFIMIILGGFMVGFGVRYAGGCTSGHAIMGISSLQWPSVVATCCFMIGGFLTANFLLPLILKM
jgi:uncharacterized membrane protein YedE/YeeE